MRCVRPNGCALLAHRLSAERMSQQLAAVALRARACYEAIARHACCLRLDAVSDCSGV